jgi:4-amino-4-deoxy-L-arabinose transferase-like glycosyltransferase
VAVSLTLIVLGAAALALVWVFLVPIYQSPDEDSHLDFALCTLEHGGLLTSRNLPPAQDPIRCVHPYTLYLRERTVTSRMIHNEVSGMPSGYGTRAYFEELDRAAPRRNELQPPEGPFLLRLYPFGYYGLLAAWLHLVRGCHDGLTVLFFAARVFSVLLLVGSLLLTFATARELRLRPALALAVTAVIGFLPLTSFVSSYVQPDNLAFTLVSLCFLLALRARRRPDSGRALGWLGLALAALLVTKVHFFACVAVPVFAMFAADALARHRPLKQGLLGLVPLCLPSLLAGAVYQWTIWGTPNYLTNPDLANGGTPLLVKVVGTLRDYYNGASHRSFWGVFGWMDTPLVIGPEPVDTLVRFLIRSTTWLVLALTLWRFAQVGRRLMRLRRRGRWRQGLGIACSNPVLNSYFLFTVFMVILHLRLDNGFGFQGRHWFPFLLPIFLVPLVYAPRALKSPRARALLTTVVAAGLLLYVPVAGYFAIQAVHLRFYANPSAPVESVVARTTD